MTVQVFSDDDEAFFRWMAAHPTGLFVNTHRSRSRFPYYVLHRSGCHNFTTVRTSKSGAYRPGGYTERDFIKVCSEDVEALANWGLNHRDLDKLLFTNICKNCTPVDEKTIRRLTNRSWTQTESDEVARVRPKKSVNGTDSPKRGTKEPFLVDQFALAELESASPRRREVSGQVYTRKHKVRQIVLQRASGRCEWCGQDGFRVHGGAIYLETHHVVPLCEQGLDHPKNVVALCPNHHREAHHGELRDQMRADLLRMVSRKL